MYILTTDLSFRKFQMAISPQPVVRSTPCLVPYLLAVAKSINYALRDVGHGLLI